MTINYNVTGAKRKRLAQALGEFVHSEPVYQNAPSYAYAVGNYTVDKDGVITAPEDAPETEDAVIAALSEHGFKPVEAGMPPEDLTAITIKATGPKKGRKAARKALEPPVGSQPEDEPMEPTVAPETPDVASEPEPSDLPEAEPAEAQEESDAAAAESHPVKEATGVDMSIEDDVHLTISIPRSTISDAALERLQLLVDNKEVLFKRALKTDDLPVIVEDDTVSFPWFTLRGETGEAAAYGQFVAALCKMAREQQRILCKPYDSDNDRFAMRIFMVRLGMKGPQYALIRKLMMGDLTGNSGWRFGAPPKKGLEDTPDTTEAPADEAEEAAEPEGEPQTADVAEADTTEVDTQEPETPQLGTSSDAPADGAADAPSESTDFEEDSPAAESEVQHEQLSEQ